MKLGREKIASDALGRERRSTFGTGRSSVGARREQGALKRKDWCALEERATCFRKEQRALESNQSTLLQCRLERGSSTL
jgi:hypothetical protein